MCQRRDLWYKLLLLALALVLLVPMLSACSSRGGNGPSASTTPVTAITAASETEIYNNGNIAGVINNPTGGPTTFTISDSYKVTLITDYHWNNGQGASSGTIDLKDASGNVIGTWPVTVRSGVYWDVKPNIVIGPGTYTVVDSDPSTWAQNSQSKNQGITDVKGLAITYVANAPSSASTPSQFASPIKVALTAPNANQGVKLGDLNTQLVAVSIPPSSFKDGTSPTVTVKDVQNVPPIDPQQGTLLANPVDISIGDQPVRLNNMMQVTMKFDKSLISPNTSSDYIWAAFWDGQQWQLFQPDAVDLQAGTVTFSAGHMTALAIVKDTLSDQIKQYVKNETVAEVAQKALVDKLVGDVGKQALDHLLKDKLGLDDDQLESNLAASMVKDTEWLEITKQASTLLGNGLEQAHPDDVNELVQTISKFAATKMVATMDPSKLKDALGKITENVDLVDKGSTMLGDIAGGQYNDAAEILVDNFADLNPVVAVGQAESKVVKYGINVWKNQEIEAAYQAYKNGRDVNNVGQAEGIVCDAGNFDQVWDSIQALHNQLIIEERKAEVDARGGVALTSLEESQLQDKVKADLQAAFVARAANENQVAAQQANLTSLMQSFKDMGLFDDPIGISEDTPKNRFDYLMHGYMRILRDTFGKKLSRQLTNNDIAQLVSAMLTTGTTQEGLDAYHALLKRLVGVDLTTPSPSATSSPSPKATATQNHYVKCTLYCINGSTQNLIDNHPLEIVNDFLPPGKTVIISLADLAGSVGYQFVSFTGVGDVKIVAGSIPGRYTFIMPAHDVTFTANFEDLNRPANAPPLP